MTKENVFEYRLVLHFVLVESHALESFSLSLFFVITVLAKSRYIYYIKEICLVKDIKIQGICTILLFFNVREIENDNIL